MKRVLVLLLMVPVVAMGAKSLPPRYTLGDERSMSGTVSLPAARVGTIVRVDTMVSKVLYLFEPQQALVLPAASGRDDFYFFWAYNANFWWVRTIVFGETQFADPDSWIIPDVFEWWGDGTLRFVSPSVCFDGAVWYPEVTFNTHDPASTWYMMDEGGLGSGIWSNPYDIITQYDYDLPITWSGPDFVSYMLASNFALGGHAFIAHQSGSTSIEMPVLQSAYGQGYENSQLVYHDGTNKIVVAAGGYRTEDIGAPNNPLLVVYQESTNGGETWSDEVWLDEATIPDLPGSIPGIEGHYSNSFFDMLIDHDGGLHFAVVLVDSGYYGNESEIIGVYDVHQNDGIWTASLISDGVYGDFDPGAQYLDGDSWVHSPSLSLAPDGRLVACWNDIGWNDPGDSLFSVDIYVSGSTDGGTTWTEPLLITGTPDVDEYFSRLTTYTTNEDAYIVTMYGGASSQTATSDESPHGPMDCIQLLLVDIFGVPAKDLPIPDIAPLAVVGPNPFNHRVSLSLSLTKPTEVAANVYNIRGEVVEVLATGRMEAGEHELVFAPGKHAPGVYFCRVQTENETLFKKLVFIK